MQDFTLLVSTCDPYADCWNPFFTLLKKYWPEFNAPVVLTTERKEYSHPGFHILSAKVQGDSPRRLTWSETILRGLDKVETDQVLFMLEDYFLDTPVQDAVVRECSAIMQQYGYSYISLTSRSPGGKRPTNHPILWARDQKVAYRVNCMAALWRKDALRRYLRADENAWEFEIFGTRRAHRIPDSFYKLNEEIFVPGKNDVIHYSLENVFRGRWTKGMPAFFEKHGIQVDYDKRGFYEPKSRLGAKLDTIRLVTGRPMRFLRGMMGL